MPQNSSSMFHNPPNSSSGPQTPSNDDEFNPYHHYEEEKAPDLESVFEEFMAYHASSKANQNSMQNHEIHFGKSYYLEDYQREPELQTYYQKEAERGFNLDNLLMQFKDTIESIQRAFKSTEIQVGKLVEEVTQVVSRREEEFVEVEAQEENPINEHDALSKQVTGKAGGCYPERSPQISPDPPSPVVDQSSLQQPADPPTPVHEMPVDPSTPLLDILEDPATPALGLMTTPLATHVLHLTDEEDTEDQEIQVQHEDFPGGHPPSTTTLAPNNA
ncbi:hypothetical protein JHK87_052660 [Glycine soja]|nr:hypothetical protein JHK87_052660 [Glycine soja]